MHNKNLNNRREFSRVEIQLRATVLANTTKKKGIVSKGTHDVSLKGVFVNCDSDWPVGTECEIHLYLDGQEPLIDITVKGRVQRLTERGMGLLFTEVSLDAYEHLHSLVLLNTQDPERVEDEFKKHLGLKKR